MKKASVKAWRLFLCWLYGRHMKVEQLPLTSPNSAAHYCEDCGSVFYKSYLTQRWIRY